MSVKEFIVENIASVTQTSAHNINLTDYLYDDLGLDSLDIPELMMTLEEKYNISIPEDKIDNFETILDVVEYVNSVVP